MKTFYCVDQKFFDDGKVRVNVYPAQAETQPEDTYEELEHYDEYKDYFKKKACADLLAAQALEA